MHDNPAEGYPMNGLLIEVLGLVSPPAWDVEETWGSIDASIAGFRTFGESQRFTLAVQVGGKQTFGLTPYWAVAYIGGGTTMSEAATVRGFRAQRFAGDASVYTNVELRVFVTRLTLLVPGDIGVLGFGGVGRVFVDDPDDSGAWHPSWGGGVWFAPLTRTNAVNLSVAGSEEDTRVYCEI
jgi:hypothetical protein